MCKYLLPSVLRWIAAGPERVNTALTCKGSQVQVLYRPPLPPDFPANFSDPNHLVNLVVNYPDSGRSKLRPYRERLSL